MQKPIDELYSIGNTICTPDFEVALSRQSARPNHIMISYKRPKGVIAIGDALPMDSYNTWITISSALCSIAKFEAPALLIPLAHEVADRVGVSPIRWKISRGRNTLGSCNRKGEIALSYTLLFYPAELREFVICHELAHLTEMNHSGRFHALCDSYCGGKEKEYIKKLKQWQVPLVKKLRWQ